jgi:hypothetical protein
MAVWPPRGGGDVVAPRGVGRRYDAAVRSRKPEGLAAIRGEIARLLNEGNRWLDRSLQGTGEIGAEIVVAGAPDARCWRSLGVAGAGCAERLYRVGRLGAARAPRSPLHRDLALLFMAADVEGERVLDYERRSRRSWRRRGSR